MRKFDAFYCGEYDHSFMEDDIEEFQTMVQNLARMDDIMDYECDGKSVFLHDVAPDLDYDDGPYTPSSYYGDYSPSCPWNAPGMSVSDFI